MQHPQSELQSSGNESQLLEVRTFQAIEYLRYRYCLVSDTLLEGLLAETLFDQTKPSTRQRAFEALKSLVHWAAYSRFYGVNPALAELQVLREVYGANEQQRVLDLGADLWVALQHISKHLALPSPIAPQLHALPDPDQTETIGVPLFDLELDEFWGFTQLMRDKPAPKALVGSPLDVFFAEPPTPEPTPVVVEPVVNTPTEIVAPKPEGVFSKVYKLPTKRDSRDDLLRMLTGEDS